MKNLEKSNRKTSQTQFRSTFVGLIRIKFIALGVIFALCLSLLLPAPFTKNGQILPPGLSPVAPVSANSTYYDFTGGNLTLAINSSTTNMITTNDNWSNVNSVQGFFGRNLTGTHGVDPQTVLNTEFAGNQLPQSPDPETQVNANKGNPSAYNAGGITEFDAPITDPATDYMAIGFQGNVQANPYLVFYLNTTGHSILRMSYDLTDIDTGSNNSVSPVALQYRIGETGNFINVPEGYVADVTDGPTISGRVTSKNLFLPAATHNQPQVQVRLITTNAANTSGGSTPDEWIGVNNVVFSVLTPTAASATVGGQVLSPEGNPVARATVSVTDFNGQTMSAMTNNLGFFQFEGLLVGQTYIFEVSSKRYVFPQSTLVYYVEGDFKGISFQAAPAFDNFRFSKVKLK